MKLHWRLAGPGFAILCGLLLAGFLFSGCATREEPPVFSSDPFATSAPVTPGVAVATNSSIATGETPSPTQRGARLDVGDQVIVTFSDPQLQEHDERIKEDGTITLHLIGAVKAAGLTRGELQKSIQDEYVKQKYYQPGRLTATVKTPEVLFYVGGEVRSSGPKAYPGTMTVTKAIDFAGGFTDFARKSAVELTRAGSDKPIKINVKKALKDPRLDLPVYPGDKINVPRRWF